MTEILLAENEILKRRVVELEAERDKAITERDAAIRDLSNTTSACDYCIGRCSNEVLDSGGCSFEWRGEQNE